MVSLEQRERSETPGRGHLESFYRTTWKPAGYLTFAETKEFIHEE